MQIRYGFDIALEVAQPATILAMMDVHSDRRHCIAKETDLGLSPAIAADRFIDGRGNIVRRLSAPAGCLSLRLEGVFRSEGREDEADPAAELVAPFDLPPETLLFFYPAGIASLTFCPISRGRTLAPSAAGGLAWRPSATSSTNASDSATPRRARRGPRARPWRRALASAATSRIWPSPYVAANIPARYCNGYLGDIAVPPDPAPMDFNAWFEAFLGDRWFTFDPRDNRPRIGRILISRGRDAADIPMITTFGSHTLTRFAVVTEEIKEPEVVAA
jgi:hypothetical protein